MSEIDNATATLHALRSDLKREKESIVTLLKDPKIADWSAIDSKKYGSLLRGIGLDFELIKGNIASYQQQAKKIGKQIVAWNNEIGNQLADCIDCSAPAAALAAAQKLETKIRGIAHLKEELHDSLRPLAAADTCLRQQLAISPLVAITTLLTPGKKEQLTTGATALARLTDKDDDIPTEGGPSLSMLRQEPDRMEARFRRLDISKLPRLAEEILFHHIEVALSANREIKIFLDNIADNMEREVTILATIKDDLCALQTEPPAGLLAGLAAQTQAMAILLSGLYHKRGIQDTLNTTSTALDSINLLCLLLKNRIIPGLQKEVEVAGALLNPAALSARMTRSFFEGTSGIIRSLKLMMKSLQGKAAVSEIELQLLLEKGINNCKGFFGGTQEDLEKMRIYIDTLVGHYPKPFPYNDLFKLTKMTLLSYGAEVEGFITGHEIPADQQIRTASPPAKVGGLIESISRFKVTFQKANTEA